MATGYNALLHNIAGSGNTASGVNALATNTTGGENTAIGDNALAANTGGDDNTASGSGALAISTGSNNTAIGFGALDNNTSGSQNIALGRFAGSSVNTATNVICIGVPGENVSDSCYIGNIFGATSSSGSAVFVNGNGKLGPAPRPGGLRKTLNQWIRRAKPSSTLNQ